MKNNPDKIFRKAEKLRSPFSAELIKEIMQNYKPKTNSDSKKNFFTLKNLIIMSTIILVLTSILFLSYFPDEQTAKENTTFMPQNDVEKQKLSKQPAEKLPLNVTDEDILSEELKSSLHSLQNEENFKEKEISAAIESNTAITNEGSEESFREEEIQMIESTDINLLAENVLTKQHEDIEVVLEELPTPISGEDEERDTLIRDTEKKAVKAYLANHEPIELSRESLIEMGFNFEDDMVEYKRFIDDVGRIELFYAKSSNYNGVRLGRSGSFFKLTSRIRGIKSSGYYPKFVTNDSGEMSLRWKMVGESKQKMERGYFNEVIDLLVPVRIEIETRKLLFWFKVDEEFIRLVEKDQEENSVQNTEKETESVEVEGIDNPAPVEDDSNEKNLSDFTVMPNPLKDPFSINFQLKNSTSGKLILYNIKGEKVLTLIEEGEFTAGENVFEIRKPDTVEGLYILQLIINNGEARHTKVLIE